MQIVILIELALGFILLLVLGRVEQLARRRRHVQQAVVENGSQLVLQVRLVVVSRIE